MKSKIDLKIFAKVNLSINILGKEGNMHLLDMVLASVDIYDAISIALRNDGTNSIKISDSRISLADNSITKTLDAIKEHIGPFGVDIVVEKSIPVAAGLGGSSADAAGIILGLDKLLHLSERRIDLQKIAQKTGSDTLYMLEGGYKRVGGIGNIIEKIATKTTLSLLLAGSAEGCLTCKVYEEFDKIYPSFAFCPSDNDKLLAALRANDLEGISANVKNALYRPALALCPNIEEIAQSMLSFGARQVFMTGSGNFMAGLFDAKQQAVFAAKKLKQKGYIALATQTRNAGFEFL